MTTPKHTGRPLGSKDKHPRKQRAKTGRHQFLKVRLSDEEKARLVAAAAIRGVSESEYVRGLL